MAAIAPLNAKAQRLLRVIVAAIESDEVRKDKPESFLTYSRALERLCIEKWVHAGRAWGSAGLSDLSKWTRQHDDIPKVDALIVAEKSRLPGPGFLKAHGLKDWDAVARSWWLTETSKSIDFD